MGQAYYDEESGVIFQKLFEENRVETIQEQMEKFKEELQRFNPSAELIGEVQGKTKEDTCDQLGKIVDEFLRNKTK